MNCEKGLIRIILKYCVDEQDVAEAQIHANFWTYDENKNRRVYHPHRSHFAFRNNLIQTNFLIQSFSVKQKYLRDFPLCINRFDPLHQFKQAQQKLNISEKFLCFIEFWPNGPVDKTYRRSIYFQEPAQFTNVFTGTTLRGWVRSSTRGLPRFEHLRFFPLGWMGNPTDMKTLENSLEDLYMPNGSSENEDFHQQFAWWSTEERERYWKNLCGILEYFFLQ